MAQKYKGKKKVKRKQKLAICKYVQISTSIKNKFLS
jgi:hypothetical protein